MVHHPSSDSRLLTNLLTHEKDYAKALHALLSPPPSHALSAYAAASPPPLSHVLLQVSTMLGSADEALGRYADAVEGCREVVKRVKDMEEDVRVVLRDREILVTRLIKASKSTKNLKTSNGSNVNGHRDSLHLLQQLSSNNNSPSASSISLSSAFSSPSPSHIPLPTSTTNPKLSNAQAELQACEATLAQKEKALQIGRIEALKEGLGMRCRAMIECAWVWGEMGREAVRILEGLEPSGEATEGYDSSQGSQHGQGNGNVYAYGSSSSNDHGHSHGHERDSYHAPNQTQNRSSWVPLNEIEKPLPLPTTSSQPHQNQEERGRYYIPPAHAISDSDVFPSTSTPQRHVLARRITEEDLLRREEDEEEEGGGSSVGDDDEREGLRVVDNPRFFGGPSASTSTPTPQTNITSTTHAPMGTDKGGSPFKLVGGHKRGQSMSTSSFVHHSTPQTSASKKGKDGSPSKTGFFGSIRGLFGGGGGGSSSSSSHPAATETTSAAFYEAPDADTGAATSGGLFGRKSKKKEKEKGWTTRTEKNIREVEREAAGMEAYAHMRQSVRGRGRVVSESGTDAFFSGGGVGVGGSTTAVHSGAGEAGAGGLTAQGVGGVAAGRKLRKGKSPLPSSPQQGGKGAEKKKGKGRSSSVPPAPTTTSAISAPPAAGQVSSTPMPGMVTPNHIHSGTVTPTPMRSGTITPTHAATLTTPTPSTSTGMSPLFAGTEIEKRYHHYGLGLGAPPSTSPSPNAGVKRQKSTRKPAPTPSPPKANSTAAARVGENSSSVGVRDGLTFTVVASANASAQRRVSLGGRPLNPQPTPGPGGAQDLSRNSSMRSAASAPVKGAVNGKGRGKRTTGSVLEGRQMPSLLSAVATEMHVPKAPPRVEEIIRSQEQGGVGMRERGGEVDGLEGVRAPRSVLDDPTLVGGVGPIDGLPSSTAFGPGGGGPVASAIRGGGTSTPSPNPSPRSSPGPSERGVGADMRGRETRPAKSPLRSALKNPSRTPSPMPELHLQHVGVPPPQTTAMTVQAPRNESTPTRATNSALGPSENQDKDRRRISVASSHDNESGDEVFYEAEDGIGAPSPVAASPPAPPVSASALALPSTSIVPQPQPRPIHDEQPQPRYEDDDARGVNHNHEPRRRKSVRVSLNPTFSATPPALEYDDHEDERTQPWGSTSTSASASTSHPSTSNYTPSSGWDTNGSSHGGTGGRASSTTWGKGKQKETQGHADMWEDSSEEDVEYARARSLLSLLGGSGAGKGKGRAA